MNRDNQVHVVEEEVRVLFSKDPNRIFPDTDSEPGGSTPVTLPLCGKTRPKINNLHEFYEIINEMDTEIADLRIRLFQVAELKIVHRYANGSGVLKELLLLTDVQRKKTLDAFLASREQAKEAKFALDKMEKMKEEVQAKSEVLVFKASRDLRMIELNHKRKIALLERLSELNEAKFQAVQEKADRSLKSNEHINWSRKGTRFLQQLEESAVNYKSLREKAQQDLECVQLKLRTEREGLLRNLASCEEVKVNFQALDQINALCLAVNSAVENIWSLKGKVEELKLHWWRCNEAIKEHEANTIQALRENNAVLEVAQTESGQVKKELAYLRKDNAVLWTKTEDLVASLKWQQDQLRSEISDLKTKELELREESEALQKRQVSLSSHTDTIARLLNRIINYVNIHDQMMRKDGRKKRVNRFFQPIIGKLKQENAMKAELRIRNHGPINILGDSKMQANDACKIDEMLMGIEDRGGSCNGLRQYLETSDTGVAYIDESRERDGREERPHYYTRYEAGSNYMDAGMIYNRKEYTSSEWTDDHGQRKQGTETPREEHIYKRARRAFCRCLFGSLPDSDEESTKEFIERLRKKSSRNLNDSRANPENNDHKAYNQARRERVHNRGEGEVYANGIDDPDDDILEHEHRSHRQREFKYKLISTSDRYSSEVSENCVDESDEDEDTSYINRGRNHVHRAYTNKPETVESDSSFLTKKQQKNLNELGESEMEEQEEYEEFADLPGERGEYSYRDGREVRVRPCKNHQENFSKPRKREEDFRYCGGFDGRTSISSRNGLVRKIGYRDVFDGVTDPSRNRLLKAYYRRCQYDSDSDSVKSECRERIHRSCSYNLNSCASLQQNFS